MSTAINTLAPVNGAADGEIDAAPELAWDVLTALESSPSWNPDIRSIAVDSSLREGTTFRWKAGPATITSTVRDVDAPRRIAWTGKTLGIRAVHVYRFEAREGTTLVQTEESYDGLVARLFRGLFQKTLDRALESGLAHLKTEAERRTAP
jgi:hypothetical protein